MHCGLDLGVEDRIQNMLIR